jgi:hypothetical protein
MPRTYGATLRGNYLEWVDEAPDCKADCSISVQVTFIEESSLPKDRSHGQEMAIILEKLAASGTLSKIKDPVSWQREIRKDRSLPGRGD